MLSSSYAPHGQAGQDPPSIRDNVSSRTVFVSFRATTLHSWPHSLALSFIFSFASEIVRDCWAAVDVSAGAEVKGDPEELDLHRFLRTVFKIHHFKAKLQFSISFNSIVNVHFQKSVHSFEQWGWTAHTGRKLCLKMLSATGKNTDICGRRTIFRDIPAGLSVISSILSDIWNQDPAACFGNDKHPRTVPSRRAWALVTLWKRSECFSGDAWRVSKVGRVHN